MANESTSRSATLCTFISTLVSLAGTAILINYASHKTVNSPVPYYAPGDTMLLSLPSSASFCESVILRVDSNVSATLYMLKKKPPLSDVNNFSVSIDQTINPRDYYYLMYYLYPDANLTLDACVVSQPLDFYIFRGERNFNAWKVDAKNGSWEEYLPISKICPEMVTHAFNFSRRGSEYYIAFDNFGSNSSTVRAELHFERPEYHVNVTTIVKTCQAGGMQSSSCSVGIPFTYSYYLLLVIDPPSDGNWNTHVKVNWSCNPRISVCVLAVLGSAIAAISCCILTICSCCHQQRQRIFYEPLQ